MRIFVLRPQAGAERSAGVIAERGGEPIVAPLFELVRLNDPAPEGPFAALVLTSGNAVPALRDAPEGWRHLPVFTVGARTAARVREAGFEDARSASGNRDDLIELIGRNIPSPARILLVAGRDRHEDLPDRLGAAGYDVAIWTVYAADAVATLPDTAVQALRTGQVDAALHYSPRGARTFVKLAREAGLAEEALGLTHVTLSADVAAPLIAAGASTVLVAEYPEEAGLFAALDEVSARNREMDDARHAPTATTSVGTETTAMDEHQSDTTKKSRSRRTPPTIELKAEQTTSPETTAPVPADAHAPEAILPTEALPQEFTPPEPAAALDKPDEDISETQPQPSAVLPERKPALPWPALALAGLVGGVIGGGLVMFAWSRMTPPVDMAEIAALRAGVNSLQSATTALDRRTTAASDAAAKAASEAQAASAKLAQVGTAPDPAAITGLSQRLEQAAARIGAVESLARTAAAPSPQSLAAARIVLAERIQGALTSGQPFAADVAALAKGGGSAEQIAALNAVATSGAPTRETLLSQFRSHQAMYARELMPAAASWQDRVLGLASRIVTIRPVVETGANDPGTLLIRLENALATNRFVVASGLWNQLPEPARRASADFGATLQKRAAADAAIAKIAQDAVAALGAAG